MGKWVLEKRRWGRLSWLPCRVEYLYSDRFDLTCTMDAPLVSQVMRHTSKFCLGSMVRSLHWSYRRQDPYWVYGYVIDIEIEWFCDVLWGFEVGYPIKSSCFIVFLPLRISTALFFFCIIINKLKFFNQILDSAMLSLIILYSFAYSINKNNSFMQRCFYTFTFESNEERNHLEQKHVN